IAKAQGLPTKELLARLHAAGIEAKAAASSVDEEVALAALAPNGAAAVDGKIAAAPPRKASTQAPPAEPPAHAPEPAAEEPESAAELTAEASPGEAARAAEANRSRPTRDSRT